MWITCIPMFYCFVCNQLYYDKTGKQGMKFPDHLMIQALILHPEATLLKA